MKRNLGRLFIVILLFYTLLEASTYNWSTETNKKDVVINEAVYLKYTCVFSDKSELYVIEFNPVVDNEKYTVKLLSEAEKIIDNHRVNSFEYVLYVKQAGDFTLNLKAVVKKTNKDSIENTVLGRDNEFYEEYSITKVPLAPVKLNVQGLPQKLVGSLSLQTKHDEEEILQFTPYHYEITIEGEGNFDALKAFDFEIDGVKVFSEKPIYDTKLTEKGYRGTWTQKFAFVSEKDFVIPAQTLEYFDLSENKVHSLQTKELPITVKQNSFQKEELLDKQEPSKFVFKWEYLYYLLIFFTGFLVGKIRWKSNTKKEVKDESLCQKISQTKRLEELSVLLVIEDAQRYQELIEKIEKKKIRSISEVKKLICG